MRKLIKAIHSIRSKKETNTVSIIEKDNVTFTKSSWSHMIYIHETQHCTVGTSWFMWQSDRWFRPPNFTIESEWIERVQHIKSGMGLLNTWFDKTTLTLMRGQELWNQEQTSTSNNDTALFPLPLPRISPISCSSYCNISGYCLHKAVMLVHYI
jgi:hypothetical protein